MHTGEKRLKDDRNQLKIFLVDLEMTYAVGYFFPSKKEQFMHARQIKHHQFCVCAGYKWHHESSVYSIKITDDKKQFKKDFRNDKIIALKLHDLMTEADLIVAHNGDAFDIKHINTMFKNHGLGPIPEKKSIDTLKVSRKYFAFAGNDLDSLSKRFGGKGKIGKPDWFMLTEGDPASILKASKYCENDILKLERVFVEMRPYIKQFPHIKLKEIKFCHACKSKRLARKGIDWDGYRQYLRIRCKECGHNMKAKL